MVKEEREDRKERRKEAKEVERLLEIARDVLVPTTVQYYEHKLSLSISLPLYLHMYYLYLSTTFSLYLFLLIVGLTCWVLFLCISLSLSIYFVLSVLDALTDSLNSARTNKGWECFVKSCKRTQEYREGVEKNRVNLWLWETKKKNSKRARKS